MLVHSSRRAGARPALPVLPEADEHLAASRRHGRLAIAPAPPVASLATATGPGSVETASDLPPAAIARG
jgi:hypothetical protein